MKTGPLQWWVTGSSLAASAGPDVTTPGGVSHRHKRPQKGLVPPLAASHKCSGTSTDTSTETTPPPSGSQANIAAITVRTSPAAAAPGRVLMYRWRHGRLLRPIAGRDRPDSAPLSQPSAFVSVPLLVPSGPASSRVAPGFGSPAASSPGPLLVTSVATVVVSGSVVAGLRCSFASTAQGALPLVRAMSSASVCSAGMP